MNNLNITGVASTLVTASRAALINAGGTLLDKTTDSTPFSTGELRRKRRVVPKPYGADIEWTAKHAGAQNAGRMTVHSKRTFKTKSGDFITLKPGVYQFKKYTTAGSGKGFVEAVFKNGQTIFLEVSAALRKLL